MNVPKPYNEEKHVLKVFATSAAYALLTVFWPSLRPGLYAFYFLAGVLAQMCKFRFNFHCLAYTALLSGFFLAFQKSDWWVVTLFTMGAYIAGRILTILFDEVAEGHREIQKKYEYDLMLAQKVKMAEEKRLYEETVRKVLEEEKQSKGKPKPKSTPVEEKIIQFRK